uniref:Uncharacterized protein n=1 Tax=Amphiprion percula TaxID=161767 RepID=A0A3P8T494_AMPPE
MSKSLSQRSEVAIKNVQLENLWNIPFYDLVHDLSVGALIRVGGSDLGHDGPHRAVLLYVNEKLILLKHWSIVIYVLNHDMNRNNVGEHVLI